MRISALNRRRFGEYASVLDSRSGPVSLTRLPVCMKFAGRSVFWLARKLTSNLDRLIAGTLDSMELDKSRESNGQGRKVMASANGISFGDDQRTSDL